jgi:hypothetical protein
MKTKIRQKVRRGLLTVSLLLLPVTLYYFSPALSLQGAAAGVATGSVLVFAGLFLSALFLGRAFCGWACPLGGAAGTHRPPARAARGPPAHPLDQVPGLGPWF